MKKTGEKGWWIFLSALTSMFLQGQARKVRELYSVINLELLG